MSAEVGDINPWAHRFPEYREAIRLGANNADLHYQTAVALGKLGRIDEANAEFALARRLEGSR